jgi:hypothetical protein
MRTDAMLTSSIVLLMIVNTVAASAAAFVALLASALETGHRMATTDVVVKGAAQIPDSRFPHQEEGIADAA